MPSEVPDRRLGFLLHDVSRLLRKRFDQRAQELGLTRAQWRALAHLARNEGINQITLADVLEVEPITMARLVDRLETAGWVERRKDPNDRRAWRLFVTDKARPVLARMRAIAAENHAEALAGLPPDTVDTLFDALARIKANLATLEAAGRPGAEAVAPLTPARRARHG